MSDISGSRILIVDDAPENIDILSNALQSFKCIAALNGEKALKIAKGSNPPDLILLDIMMPGMDGFEVCRQLKENPDTQDIPVIFITGKTDVEDETRGLDLGATDFIPKPISTPVVYARVKNHLEFSQAKKKLKIQYEESVLQNKFITDSINYAKRIQTAILPSAEDFQNLFPDSFLLFLPKDIVSGDFYWCGEHEGKKIVAVADCTGHGVPGAFMSMIGNTLLNDIVYAKQITIPDNILAQLDSGIIDELNKDLHEGTLDGMDISVCMIDQQIEKIYYAGAYRPLYYQYNGEFFEVKGTKKSIGDNRKSVVFELHEIPFQKNLLLYLFSDGFTDQNDSEGKKFGSGKLKQILSEHADKAIQEQFQILHKAFLEHKSSEAQRDDVTFLGIRI
ncbi:MAG: Regulator of RpoS [Ignavibacteriaceae bacterium]|nr:Regulator of RpoS [Ignavibacteriaceae bacterium]